MKTFAEPEVAETLLKAIEEAVQKALDAGVDGDWILPAVEHVIYGKDET